MLFARKRHFTHFEFCKHPELRQVQKKILKLYLDLSQIVTITFACDQIIVMFSYDCYDILSWYCQYFLVFKKNLPVLKTVKIEVYKNSNMIRNFFSERNLICYHNGRKWTERLECNFIGYDVMLSCIWLPSFWKNVSSASSGLQWPWRWRQYIPPKWW